MAQTKVKLISDGVIVQGNLHASHGITTAHIGEGSNLYYTDARVGSYLSTNSFATESYVGTQIANLVDSSPSTLNTLNELAAALGDDANFSTTVTNSIALKAPLASPSFTGNAAFGGSLSVTGTSIFTGQINVGSVVPRIDSTFSLGSNTLRFASIYGDGLTITNNATFGGSISSGADIFIPVGEALFFGASEHTYIMEDVDDRLRFFTGGTEFMRFTESTSDTVDIYKDATFAGTVLIDGLSNYTGLEVKGAGASRPQIKFSNVNQGTLAQIYGTESNSLVTTVPAGLEYQVRNANGASGNHVFKSYNTAILTLDGGTNNSTFAGLIDAGGRVKVSGGGTDQYYFEGARNGVGVTYRLYDNANNAYHDSYTSQVIRVNQLGGSGGGFFFSGGDFNLTTTNVNINGGTGYNDKSNIYLSNSRTLIQSDIVNATANGDTSLDFQTRKGGTTASALFIDQFRNSVFSFSVGIGMTPSADAKLEIANGNFRVRGSSANTIQLSNTSGNTRAALGNAGNEGDLSLYRSNNVKHVYLSSYYNSYINPSNGNLGIGTTTPDNKLQVVAGNGNVQAWFGEDNYTRASLRVGGNNSPGGRLFFEYNGDDSYIDSYGGHGSTQRYRDLTIASRNIILTTGNTSGSEKARVTENGNVLVGITTTQNAGILQIQSGTSSNGGILDIAGGGWWRYYTRVCRNATSVQSAGYWHIKTNISPSSSIMFMAKFYGYIYGSAQVLDLTHAGYAYAGSGTVINQAATNNGSDPNASSAIYISSTGSKVTFRIAFGTGSNFSTYFAGVTMDMAFLNPAGQGHDFEIEAQSFSTSTTVY